MRNPYVCICCGYSTFLKNDMRKHFYKKLKPCPKSANDIELTDEIREYILVNRVYHIPVQPPVTNNTVNQIINNNNTINNYVASMDAVEKINKYLSFNDISLLDYGDTIENKFKTHAKRFEEGKSDHLALDKYGILDVIDQASSLANQEFQNLNILYDEKFNKLKLYDLGKWNDVLVTNGVRTLLTKIQEFYFDQYECYLIRKIEYSGIPAYEKQVFKERLHNYYRFLGCFDIDPFVKGKNDSEIKYNMDDDRNDPYAPYTDENRAVPIKYLDMYVKVCGETMKNDIIRIKREVIEIVKKNSKKNVDDLNKKIVVLFNMDEEFKTTMLAL